MVVSYTDQSRVYQELACLEVGSNSVSSFKADPSLSGVII